MNLVIAALGGAALGALIAWLAGRAAAERLRAQLAAQQESALERERQLAEARADAERLRAQASADRAQLAAAETALQKEREKAAEQLQLLDARFKQLSQEILEEKSRRFTEQNRENIEQILKPLREKLGDFEKQVKEAYDKETRDRVALFQQIRSLQDLNQKVAEDARNLAVALKGEAKAQGAWGELILERVFEMSGLVRGREYETQFSTTTEDGNRRRPDAVVRLPDGRDVVIDAKVSLTAYARAVAAASDAERERALAEHVASVRNHIRGLSGKEYQGLPGLNSLDFVLMFVPSEAAYIEAIRAAPELYDEALSRNLALVSPTTLLPTLRTIENLWNMDRQHRNAQQIAAEAGKLYDQFVLFEQSLSEIGSRLTQAQAAYDTARRRLVEGRGNLIGRAEKLRELGARSAKSLPAALTGGGQPPPDASDVDPG
ncbi:MAG: DNA recombination protein RmuC [Nevskia sp.]|nr:DNA recombination protein RmuC [Nevskia sp.]